MKRRILVLLLLTLLLLLNYLNFSQLVSTEYFPIINTFGKFIFSNICHLHEHKLFIIGEFSSILCSRCSGIYLGAMLTSVLLIFFDIRIKFKLAYLFGALLPSLTDIFLYNLGIYSYNIFIALFTGILLGVFGFYYFYLGILNYYLEKKKE